MHMPIVVLPFSLSFVAFLPLLVGVALTGTLATLGLLWVARPMAAARSAVASITTLAPASDPASEAPSRAA